MKKIICLSLAFISLFAFASIANAATITKAEYDGKIKLEGTGSNSVQIVLFDKDSNPIYMTTALTNDGKFQITLPEIAGLEIGNYQVKVADYDGKNTDVETVAVTDLTPTPTTSSTDNASNPKTGDNIMPYFVVSGIAILGIAGSIILINCKKKNCK